NCRFLHRSSLTPDVFRGNTAVWITVGALLVLQLAYTYVPFIGGLFDARPLAPLTWLVTFGLAVAIFFAVEGLKAIRNRLDPDED
ncbi:cation transporting ATPase C-terminal domain-containing protein, partial [Microbacterium sp. HMH0099]